MDNIKEICKSLNFAPKLCMELGCAHVTTAQLRDFVEDGIECIMVECNSRLFWCLQHGYNNENGRNFLGVFPNQPPPPYDNLGWKDKKNVKLIHAAIADYNGTTKIYECNASTFVDGINSPAKVNDNYKENEKDAMIVPAITVDTIDNGKIDLLACDMEGSEYLALKHLISRPYIIILEVYGQNYVNPYKKEIDQWMIDNGYEMKYRDATDVLWIKK